MTEYGPTWENQKVARSICLEQLSQNCPLFPPRGIGDLVRLALLWRSPRRLSKGSGFNLLVAGVWATESLTLTRHFPIAVLSLGKSKAKMAARCSETLGGLVKGIRTSVLHFSPWRKITFTLLISATSSVLWKVSDPFGPDLCACVCALSVGFDGKTHKKTETIFFGWGALEHFAQTHVHHSGFL